MSRVLRAGTRASALARAQTAIILAQLAAHFPDCPIELVPIITHGDRDQRTPLHTIGGQGIFVQALHEALIAGTIDFAVHSAKDLPSRLPPGIVLAAIPSRDDPRDVVITRDGRPVAALPPGSRIGTSSTRRTALVRNLFPHLAPTTLRGNVDTRLRKLDAGEVDAVVLAAAGLHRLGLSNRITEYLPPDTFVPAPGQGALAVTCRSDDVDVLTQLQSIDDPAIRLAVEAERTVLSALGSGCALPVGSYAVVEGTTLTLHTLLATQDGTQVIRRTVQATVDEALPCAKALASQLAAAVLGQTLEANDGP